jgi:hypothetical protein
VEARADRQPSGSAPSATGRRIGTHQLRQLLAARGDAGLWLADDDGGGETLLRLYPGLPMLGEWHVLKLAASELVNVVDARLVPIDQITLDVWPCLSFACPDAEPLARRIARAPMAPAAAVAMCADVAGALAALRRAGVPPVDVSPADIVLVGERAQLLADVGLPAGRFAPACVDLDHVAPERAAAIADPARRDRGTGGSGAFPTAESMTYALASTVSAAIRGPQRLEPALDGEAGGAGPAPSGLPTRLELVLRRGLAQSPSARYRTPAALVEALGDAVGVHPSHRGASASPAVPGRRASAPRAPRTRDGRAGAAPPQAKPRRARVGIAIPAAVLLVAAAIGTAVGSAGTAPDAPAPVTLAGAGLSVEVPRGWLRAAPGDVTPAVGAPALVAHPPGRSSATALVVTRAAAPLLAKLAGAAPEPVRVGADDAWRYRDVAVGADSVADVYVLGDGDGSIVAACLSPSGAPASARTACSAALTTLRLHAGRANTLGGGAAARRGLAHVVEDLDRERASARRALGAATTGRRQAAAAGRLAAAYARAADGAASSRTVGAPGDLPRLVDRLEETGRAYAALATAARTTRRTAYAHARERIVAHERALHEDLAALASASAER